MDRTAKLLLQNYYYASKASLANSTLYYATLDARPGLWDKYREAWHELQEYTGIKSELDIRTWEGEKEDE